MNGLKYIQYSKNPQPRHVVNIKTDAWRPDTTFYPFFYSDKPINDKRVKCCESVRKNIFWTNKSINLYKITTFSPSQVSELANELTGKQLIFSADIPYLANYLIQTQQYIYKDVNRLSALIFDIEAEMFNMDEHIGNPFCIGMAKGYIDMEDMQFVEEKRGMLSTTNYDKREIIRKLGQIVNKVDLAIAHNIDFDWGCLATSAKADKIPFPATAKDGVYNMSLPANMRGSTILRPRNSGYLDTMFGIGVSIARPESFALKFEVEALGLRKEDRIELSSAQIPKLWHSGQQQKVINYCMDDIDDTILLFNKIAPNIFAPCKMAGIPVEQLINSGVGTIWQTLLMRDNIEKNTIIPQFSRKVADREGAYGNPHLDKLPQIKGGETKKPTRCFEVIDDVYEVDIGAAYPNATRQYNISPESVSLAKSGEQIEFEDGTTAFITVSKNKGVLPNLLSPMMTETYQIKQQLKYDDSLNSIYQGYKGAINSSFGFMDMRVGQGRYINSYASAFITQKVRDIINDIERMVVARGGEMLCVDTDSVKFTLNTDPGDIHKDIEKKLIRKYGAYFGEVEGTGLDLTHYSKFYFLGHKNYACINSDGSVKLKGSKLVSRSFPKISRVAIKDITEEFLLNGVYSANARVAHWKNVIKDSDNPNHFAFSMSLNKKYKSSAYQNMANRLGYGLNMLYVTSPAKLMPKPFNSYELLEEFDADKVNHEWYKYHLEYLANDVLKIGAGKQKYLEGFW